MRRVYRIMFRKALVSYNFHFLVDSTAKKPVNQISSATPSGSKKAISATSVAKPKRPEESIAAPTDAAWGKRKVVGKSPPDIHVAAHFPSSSGMLWTVLLCVQKCGLWSALNVVRQSLFQRFLVPLLYWVAPADFPFSFSVASSLLLDKNQ